MSDGNGTGTAAAARRCAGLNSAGAPCGAFAAQAGDYCTAHDPDVAAQERMQAARRLGGVRAMQAKRDAQGIDEDALGPLRTYDDIARWGEVVGHALGARRIAPDAAKVLQSLADQQRKILDAKFERELDDAEYDA